jgi:hypothetical protein
VDAMPFIMTEKEMIIALKDLASYYHQNLYQKLEGIDQVFCYYLCIIFFN